MSAPIILCDTAGMSRERWLECRMHGPKGDIPYTLGGSDIAAIFGVSPWTTPLELWRIKKGLMEPPVKANASQLQMGHYLEPIAAQLYADKTGDTVIVDTNLYQHADHPYALGNFDRRIVRKSDGANGILECKSTSYHKADAWAMGAFPLYYEFQLRYYLAIADVEFGHFAAFWGNNPDTDFVCPGLVRDKEKEDIIFQKCDEFIWSLEHDKPPTMEDVAPKLALESLARIYGNSVPATPTIEFDGSYEKALRRIAFLQDEISQHNATARKLEKEVEAHSVRIAELMKENERGVLETTKDKLLIDFVTKSKTTVDKDKLKELYPTVFDDVQKTTYSRKVKVSIATV